MHYDRHAYLPEKRAALGQLAQLVSRIVDSASDLVDLEKRRASTNITG
jgi:hypothetical protein